MAKKSMKLGAGGRFQAIKSKIAKEPEAIDPAAITAAIGRKKFGNEKFQAMSQHGPSFANALKKK